jgi:hypothetical protein
MRDELRQDKAKIGQLYAEIAALKARPGGL